MFASAAVGTAFPVLLFLVYGLMHIRTIRRERRYARERAVFLDNVSHELKTPISGIRLNAELLADGRISDEGQRRDAMEAMIVETDRIGRLVDELLDFSRLERGMRKLSLVPLELSAYVLDPVEVQRTAGVSRGLAKVKVVGPCACVVADVDALRQIGTILISNALKYAGGEIEIEAEGCCLRCMDRGPGVPRGDEERIFDRFYRCDDSLTAKASGSGLGLAIARTLAREMGGELEYAHRPGGGSVFTLRLREAER